MTLVDNNGRVITKVELAMSYASDLRTYTSLTREEINARLWDRYPGVMKMWAIEDKMRDAS